MTLQALPGNPYLNPAFIDRLNDRQLQEFAPALTLKWNKYIPHSPSERQWVFLALDVKEAMYGGAAGGGKSDCALMGALQYVDEPNYAALLLRRTYADLSKPGALIPRSHEWLDGTDAHWDGSNKQWRFPSGAFLDFGYIDHDGDEEKFKSAEYQFIGFDELTQFMLKWYRYLFSRARRLTTMLHIPVRVRGYTNPDGLGHEWVKQRFLVEGSKYGRVFVKAQLDDNPYIDQEEYDRALQELDPTVYAQLRHGNWDVQAPGAFFNSDRFKIIPEAPPGLRWIRSWDLAATKNQTSAYTAGVRIARHGNDFFIDDIVRRRGDPGETEELVRQTAERDGIGVSIWMEQEGGSGGINTIWRYSHEILAGFDFNPYKPREDKLTRARPFSAAVRFGQVYLVRGPWITEFFDEANPYPNGFKDQIDATVQGYNVLMMQPEPSIRRLGV